MDLDDAFIYTFSTLILALIPQFRHGLVFLFALLHLTYCFQ